ncbi:MAG: cysteine desulfurase [Ruminococcaceae bacterium]|nr:cysteine desulfurase [Oscillospiraceae bacterium]
MAYIYLDSAATTAMSERSIAAMNKAALLAGNPSSIHKAGLEAASLLSSARSQLMGALGIRRPRETTLLFTSCGSEANNTVFFGSAYAKARNKGRRIVLTDSEHPSAARCADRLESEGYRVTRLSTKGGVIDERELREAVKDAFLLSLMAVNNETGAVYDIQRLFSIAKEENADIITHTDGVQAFLKIPLSFDSCGADCMSISSHKIHGPKGVGALVVKNQLLKAKKLIPFLCGGGQEGGFRAGTENLTGIAAFGEAAEEGKALFDQTRAHAVLLKEALCEALPASVRVNHPKSEASPFIVSLTLPGVRSETMLHFLSAKGICVSAGSACSASSGRISSTLLAFGLPEKEADCTLRVSFSRTNTVQEIAELVNALNEGLSHLARTK